MLNLDRWQEIYGTIRRNKLRTFLTALSVAWGIFMLVILLGAGTGLQNSVSYKFRDDAINSIWIWGGKTSIPHQGLPPGRDVKFTNADYESIRAMPGVDRVTGRFRTGRDPMVVYKDRHSAFDLRSVHPDHRYLENTIMISGRFINDLDMAERRKVVVIGLKVDEFLFRGEPSIDKWITIAGMPYQVIGTFKDAGGEGEMRKMYIPISTAQMAYNGVDRIHMLMFTISGDDMATSRRLEGQVRSLLAARHDFSPNDKRALRVRNNLESFHEVSQMFVMIRYFVWVVGIGTIIAGIVGVSNIMLISVKERTREIGLRKAIGATPGSLVGLILQEAIVLTAVAGYAGLTVGVGVLELVNRLLPADSEYLRDPQVDLGTVLGATVLLVFFGALAGYFPARRAARVNPIVALRDE
ncbi:MAG TPA: ABC transporter permease [Kofleriaceae bacterium]|nr:ABC transporter permease [Kofleriaceae bacterium]